MERPSDWLDGDQLNKVPPAYFGPKVAKRNLTKML
jgi:hypothetical protein